MGVLKKIKKLLRNIIQATQKIFLRSLYGAVMIQMMPLGAIGSNWEQLGTIGNNWEQLGAIGNNWEPLGAIHSLTTHRPVEGGMIPHSAGASTRGNDPPYTRAV